MTSNESLRYLHDNKAHAVFGQRSVSVNFMCHPDSHYALLRAELESNAQNLEAESWSLAVDQNYLKGLNKEAVKRQDVIYGMFNHLSLSMDDK